jgi:hypothetical protein
VPTLIASILNALPSGQKLKAWFGRKVGLKKKSNSTLKKNQLSEVDF